MAYSKSNELKTRIALKYDSYLNWTTNNPVLLAGEVAIATIQTGSTQTVDKNNISLPQTLIKVGDGTSKYNALPFVSALAADVYDWAKAADKPEYEYQEIKDIGKVDTNTEYRITEDDNSSYKFNIEKRTYAQEKWSNWAVDDVLDLTAYDTRFKAIEDVLKKAGLDSESGDLTALINSIVNAKVLTLDGSASQTAGADGLALSVTQLDGVVTAISGSIAPNTYDSYGAAKAVQGETTHTVAEAYALADAAQTKDEVAAAVQAEANARDAAIKALDAPGVSGSQAAGTTVSFVSSVSETDGIISASLGTLKLAGTYNPSEVPEEANYIATMKNVTDAVANLNGAMHFEGVSTTDPINARVTIADKPGYVAEAGDVVIYVNADNVPVEYVYDGSKWHQLGNESIAQKAIENLDVADIPVGADSTLSVIGEEDGLIHATAVKIQIAENQVTGLVDDLASKATNAALKDATDDIAALQEAVTNLGGGTNGSVADQIAAAVGALDADYTVTSGKYIASVKQVDGKVSATYGDLPVIPTLELVEGTATDPVAEKVSVIADIDVDGHKITDTRVNVATVAGISAAIARLDADKDVSSAKHVMTGITEIDGVITGIDEVALADVAFSGNVKDLVQTAETYVLFNCGTSSEVI